MKIKTSELSGIALDWAVAKCEGRDIYAEIDKRGNGVIWFKDITTHKDGYNTAYGSWETCGPIIEREKIKIYYAPDINCGTGEIFTRWFATLNSCQASSGKTALEATMRCYVASKLGNEVEIPEELL